jgi:hypothetical protein
LWNSSHRRRGVVMRPTVTELPVGHGSVPPLVPAALAPAGYTEREFLLEGTAAIYGPSDPSPNGRVTLSRAEIVPFGEVMRTDVPYATRMILRSPDDMERFSGTVVVEPIHNVGEHVPSWNVTYRHYLRCGHAWIGVTVSTGPHIGVGGRSAGGTTLLRQLDPARYGVLRLEAGEPDDWPLLRERDDRRKGLMDVLAESAFTGKSTDATAFGVMVEEIYRTNAHSPDVVSQLAAHLKVDGLDGWPVEHLIGTGASGTTVWWNAFIDGGHHDRARNFDAYLLYVANPPRQRPRNAAVVNVLSEAEAMLAEIEGDAPPPDTDVPVFRQYELAGTGHQLSGADEAGVTDALSTQTSTLIQTRPAGLIPYDRVNHPILHGIWRALEAWIAEGVPMPPSIHIDRDADGEGGLARDQYGNACGGLRPPWVDVPNARYFARSPWNPLRGCIAPFTADRMRELYGTVETYRATFKRAVESLVADGWVGAEEADHFDPGDF